MLRFVKGLKLEVIDREDFKEFLKENLDESDYDYFMEHLWHRNGVPDTIYIRQYNDKSTVDGPPVYETYDRHVNDELTSHEWDAPFLRKAIANHQLYNTGEYNTELIDAEDPPLPEEESAP